MSSWHGQAGGWLFWGVVGVVVALGLYHLVRRMRVR